VAAYRLLSGARRELEATVSFYDSIYPALGRDFVLEVQALCQRIAESPMAGVEVRPNIRRRILRRFPYSILYAIEHDEVIVVAVAHQKRLPGNWTEREDI
jgi:plasmid stabilization system protein ParE